MNAEEPAAESPARAAPRPPWQPLTFRGVALFSKARLGRLWLMELIVAVLVGLTLVWFLQKNYAPVIAEAVRKMPDGAIIQAGRLTGVQETLLSETKLIAIAVTPDESTDIGQSADAQVQFRRDNFRIGSVFRPDWGWEFDYGPRSIDVSRTALEPLWGAWHPVVFAACGLGAVLGLGIGWTVLALIYSAPALLGAWFADRQVSWWGAWKMCSAALMPGALLLILALVLYGIEAVDLIGLACFFAGHFVVAWIYIAGGIAFLERAIPPPPKNPFTGLKSA